MSDEKKFPQVYERGSDELIDVTQDWCDLYQKTVGCLAYKIETVKAVLALHPDKDRDRLEAINVVISRM